MGQSLHSPSWYRVARLRPRLKSHAEIHRHFYRGDLWYVLQDHASSRFQRFTPSAYRLIGLMDGRRTVQEIWDTAVEQLGEDAPTQEEVVRLLSQLHSVDALQGNVPPDVAELEKRFSRQRRQKFLQNIKSPLFVRFPLLDPERFLNRFQHLTRPFFGWSGMVLWLVVVAPAIFQVAVHWQELTMNLADRILTVQNIFLIWLIFPVLKALHEFGHAFALKVKGGEVHEMGIMLLVFTPIPYVDASTASAFHKKRDRVLVGAAGMMVEVFCAALAVFVWINAEPGTLRAVMFNVMLIAGISSVLFNGNPLLRYDAYYILTDLLEIPNLSSRGIRYVGFLFQRHLFGMTETEPPLATAGERVWFLIYTPLAFLYRLVIYGSIILFVAGKFFFIGVLFAIWAVVNMFVLPIGKVLRFVLSAPQLHRRRFRAVAVSFGTAALLVFLVAGLPVPLSTVTEGVLWVPEDAMVRAGADGFVERVLVPHAGPVEKGTPLIEFRDPFLPANIRVLESKIRELEAIYDTQRISDRVASEITRDEIAQVTAELDDARRKQAELTVRSAAEGTVHIPGLKDLPGRFIARGSPVGFIMAGDSRTVRTVVDQAAIDLVRYRTTRVDVRLSHHMSHTYPAIIKREVPAATDQLPSAVLSQEGGGSIALDPSQGQRMKTYQKIFLFDLDLLQVADTERIGSRVYVRFQHGREPIAWRWYRAVRRIFLKRFNA